MTNTEELAAFGREVRELFERARTEGWTAGQWLVAARDVAVRRGIADDNDNPEVDLFDLWLELRSQYA